MADHETARLSQAEKDQLKLLTSFAYDIDHFFVVIVVVNGRTVYIPQVPLKVIVDHLMPTANITEGGAYALKQPNRYGPVSYLWLVGIAAHHGLEILDDKEELRRLIIDELRHLRLAVPPKLKALEGRLRKQPLQSLVSASGAVSSVATFDFVAAETPIQAPRVRNSTPANQLLPSIEDAPVTNDTAASQGTTRGRPNVAMGPPPLPIRSKTPNRPTSGHDRGGKGSGDRPGHDKVNEEDLDDDEGIFADSSQTSASNQAVHSNASPMLTNTPVPNNGQSRKRKSAHAVHSRSKTRMDPTSHEDESNEDEVGEEAHDQRPKKKARRSKVAATGRSPYVEIPRRVSSTNTPRITNDVDHHLSEDDTASSDSESTGHVKRTSRLLKEKDSQQDMADSEVTCHDTSSEETSESDETSSSGTDSSSAEEEDSDESDVAATVHAPKVTKTSSKARQQTSSSASSVAAAGSKSNNRQGRAKSADGSGKTSEAHRPSQRLYNSSPGVSSLSQRGQPSNSQGLTHGERLPQTTYRPPPPQPTPGRPVAEIEDAPSTASTLPELDDLIQPTFVPTKKAAKSSSSKAVTAVSPPGLGQRVMLNNPRRVDESERRPFVAAMQTQSTSLLPNITSHRQNPVNDHGIDYTPDHVSRARMHNSQRERHFQNMGRRLVVNDDTLRPAPTPERLNPLVRPAAAVATYPDTTPLPRPRAAVGKASSSRAESSHTQEVRTDDQSMFVTPTMEAWRRMPSTERRQAFANVGARLFDDDNPAPSVTLAHHDPPRHTITATNPQRFSNRIPRNAGREESFDLRDTPSPLLTSQESPANGGPARNPRLVRTPQPARIPRPDRTPGPRQQTPGSNSTTSQKRRLKLQRRKQRREQERRLAEQHEW